MTSRDDVMSQRYKVVVGDSIEQLRAITPRFPIDFAFRTRKRGRRLQLQYSQCYYAVWVEQFFKRAKEKYEAITENGTSIVYIMKTHRLIGHLTN